MFTTLLSCIATWFTFYIKWKNEDWDICEGELCKCGYSKGIFYLKWYFEQQFNCGRCGVNGCAVGWVSVWYVWYQVTILIFLKLLHLEDHAISLIFIHNWMCYIANKMVLIFNLGLFIYLFKSNILVFFW